MEQGIQLDDGMTAPAKAALVEGAEAKRALSMLEVPPAVPDHEPNGSVPSPQRAAILRKRSQQRAVVRVVLREGRKRQVKRMLSAIKHGVWRCTATASAPSSWVTCPAASGAPTSRRGGAARVY